jgi:hypothetical protein
MLRARRVGLSNIYFLQVSVLFVGMIVASGHVVAEPPSQSEFVAVVSASQQALKTAKNDMVKGSILAKRNAGICSVLKTKKVTERTGTAVKLTTNGEGWGVIEVEIADDVYLKTWNNSFSDSGDFTLIDLQSELFARASELEEGQEVVFSGEFLDDRKTCIRETSITMDGGLEEPEFLFRFSSIKGRDG